MSQINSNFFQCFAVQFDRHRSKVLIETDQDERISYQDVNEQSARIANLLVGMGLTVGDRVSVQVDKSPQTLCLYLACLRAGLIFHPLNPAYTADELDYFLCDAEPSLVVCDSASLDSTSGIAKKAKVTNILTLDADGSGSLVENAAQHSDRFDCVQREPSDTAALLYSSGTTGVPKGIMLTHQNLTSNTETLVKAWGFSCEDRLLHALPIFHVHGLFVALGCVLFSGASMKWLPALHVKNIIRFLPHCTVLMGVPTYYTRLLADAQFSKEVSDNIRLFVSGSAPLLEETFFQFEQRTGQRILERYGMTETNMNTSNPLIGERRPGTVGPALEGINVRVVDDQNLVLEPDEIGNLQVRGPNVFKGYWKMPDKTAEDFTEDGYFKTGDKAKQSRDGYISIVGRSKDVVISGGLNVYPKEVELLIDEMNEVQESAVVGIPHSDFGEAVVAIVVPRESATLSESAVLDFCKPKLANFKQPKRVIIVEQLPRNTMGKVQKNLLRDNYANITFKK